ncbi:YeiH family protein [Ornithinibacillus halophilus]|uniref:Conserved hypothetical integral membrane protein n=1 Tax=Ornithinibacillus halophilus TaxID=930117 RepID=A0A1M5JAD6_9BACI|nr:putative sulfate exporter family transporter [Ornithinibacillus halophilus]SHG37522.1 conserved hypothetical integral membrane protein [Ornithinibacillus halophilus]
MKSKIITLLIIGLATWLATFIGGTVFPLLGTAISAIILGMIIRHTPPIYNLLDKATNKFITSYVLKGGIVLLGFTLSLQILNKVGMLLIVVMATVILGSIVTSILINKFVKANNKLSLMIGIGTSICGGSAIVASAPIIEAEDEDVAVAITTMFVFSMTALVILPIIGTLFNFSDHFYGVVAGLAVNDTPSVLATAFSWSDEAGEIATIVKVAKTLFIIPITLGLVYLKILQQRKNAVTNDSPKVGITWAQIKSVIPMFVVYFTLAFIIASVVAIPAEVTSFIKDTSKLMFTFALVAIGLGVHVKQIKKAGIKPILIGAACSFVVIGISVASVMVIY